MQLLQQDKQHHVDVVETAPKRPVGELVFSSSRVFWRTKSRFNVYLFLHKHCRCIEIVSALVEENGVALTSDVNVKIAPRVFLNLDALEAQYKALQIGNGEGNKSAESKTSASEHQSATLYRDVVQSLKLDYLSVQNGQKSVQEALYFDDSLSYIHQLASPLLFEKPADLILTDCTVYCRAQANGSAVQEKLDALSQARKQLSEAVDKAHVMATKINFRPSPRQRPLLLSPLANYAAKFFSPKRSTAKFSFDIVSS
eukprot:CAMPEP_0202975240 /NCGR_PEP_ID=MMETSP1396-20130829/67402_1 /ASSEMBLY_ACC=CAM_ASM_000872 /TAXON_ID= /ORGANISM="Pseudokeronopsis sp., Strain Brazil" /LENGTH=255 /DNA_ID=CAMNT_0049710473 /DNA_START=1 /DNA_END=768 /DNA_ORIENTATION=-